ncbi:MAG: hypothetical protein R6U93_01925 [Dehalococcoidia bacterium]|jgi:hypothetical protein
MKINKKCILFDSGEVGLVRYLLETRKIWEMQTPAKVSDSMP